MSIFCVWYVVLPAAIVAVSDQFDGPRAAVISQLPQPCIESALSEECEKALRVVVQQLNPTNQSDVSSQSSRAIEVVHQIRRMRPKFIPGYDPDLDCQDGACSSILTKFVDSLHTRQAAVQRSMDRFVNWVYGEGIDAGDTTSDPSNVEHLSAVRMLVTQHCVKAVVLTLSLLIFVGYFSVKWCKGSPRLPGRAHLRSYRASET